MTLVFGSLRLVHQRLRLFEVAFSGSHGESGLIVVEARHALRRPAGGRSWSACAMLSMISRRLIASDIAFAGSGR